MLAKLLLPGLLAGVAVAQSTMETAHTTECEVSTSTAYGITPRGNEHFDWLSSLQAKYLTEGNTWTGSRVPVFTSVYNQSGTHTMTGLGFLETGILQAEGYEIVSSVVTVTDCETSPTGVGSSEGCTPHVDHWHCPPGVEEPSYAPGDEHEHHTGVDDASETECVAHDDHWHCPDGIPEPTSEPEASATSDDSEQEGVGVTESVYGNGILALTAGTIVAGIIFI